MLKEIKLLSLKPGMSLREVSIVCGGREAEHLYGDTFSIQPINALPDFERYIVKIDNVIGLYFLRMDTGSIKVSSGKGTELREAFQSWVESLEQKYGIYLLCDHNYSMETDWNESDRWFEKLKKNYNVLCANWLPGSKLPKGVDYAFFYAKAKEGDALEGFLSLELSLSNVHDLQGFFGLEKGMTLEEVTRVCGGVRPEKIDDEKGQKRDTYEIKPAKANPLFNYYQVKIKDEYYYGEKDKSGLYDLYSRNLYEIQARSHEIHVTSARGIEFRNEFYSFLRSLRKKYGKAIYTDGPQFWCECEKDDRLWMYELFREHRVLYATWSNEPDSPSSLPEDIKTIILQAKGREFWYSDDMAVWVGYINIRVIFSFSEFN